MYTLNTSWPYECAPGCTYLSQSWQPAGAQGAELPSRCVAKSSSWPCVEIGAAFGQRRLPCCCLYSLLLLLLLLSYILQSDCLLSPWHSSLQQWHLEHLLCAHCPSPAAIGDSFAAPSVASSPSGASLLPCLSLSDCNASSAWCLAAKVFRILCEMCLFPGPSCSHRSPTQFRLPIAVPDK